MSNKPKIDALQKLINSPGWAVLKEAMQQDIVSAAMAIADNPSMHLDEINFRRGSIWAGKQLLSAPELIITKMQNDDAFDRSKSPTDT